MNPTEIVFRPAEASDQALLQRALLLNATTVDPEAAVPADIDRLPRFRRYWQDFPGAHDFGVVAEVNGVPIGVVWARFSAESDPAPGWVDDDIPEITICVFEGQRGLGVGHDLLDEIEKEALRRGFRSLSLWVEPGNRSRRLYERRGFHPVDGVFDGGTMLKRL